MATTDKINYAASAPITCTFAGLANSAARSSLAVDNSVNLYDDAILDISVLLTGGGTAFDKACYVYFYGCGQNGIFNGSSAENVGTDIAVTMDSPTNLIGPITISTPSVGVTYRLTVGSMASLFGGVLPWKWGFVIFNYAQASLDSTESNHTKAYTGITYTNA